MEYQSANPHFDSLLTFCIQPSDDTLPDRSLIDQSVPAFYLRNALELGGYQYTRVPDSADFIVTVDLRGEYHKTRIPQRSITLPVFDAERKIVVGHSELGYEVQPPVSWRDLDPTVIARSLSDAGTIPTTSPIYHGPDGDYYWISSVAIYDGHTHSQIWMGNGIIWTDLANYLMSFQDLINVLCARIPKATRQKDSIVIPSGLIGIFYAIQSTNGRHFYPFVTELNTGGAAERAGIKQNDIIIQIDGESSMDLTFYDAYKKFAGGTGVPVQLKVARNGQILDFTVVRDPRPR